MGRLTHDTFMAAYNSAPDYSNYQLFTMLSNLGFPEYYAVAIIGTTYGEGYPDDPYLLYEWSCTMINMKLENYRPEFANADEETFWRLILAWGNYSESFVRQEYRDAGGTDAYAVMVRKCVYLSIVNRDRNTVGTSGDYYSGMATPIYHSTVYPDIWVWYLTGAPVIDDSDYTTFTVRTTSPVGSFNKCYMTDGIVQQWSADYWNPCIIANGDNVSAQYGANALPNCVGYCSGRLLEVYNELTNSDPVTTGEQPYQMFAWNAVDWYDYAPQYGCTVGSEPVPGSVICWGEYGKAGHVAFVEQVISPDHIICTESGYDSPNYIWVTRDRYRNSGSASWGCDYPYYFRGFIYPLIGGTGTGGDSSGAPLPPSPEYPPSGIGRSRTFDWWKFLKRRV